MPATRVLLVEDDVDLAEGLILLLEREGFALSWARTGAEALQTLDSAQHSPAAMPDALLLDWMLPDMGGEALLDRLPALEPPLPVIFYSAAAESVLQHAGRKPGVLAAMRKPNDYLRVIDVLRGIVSGPRKHVQRADTGRS